MTVEPTSQHATKVDVKTPEQVASLIKLVDKKHNLKITPEEMKIMMAIAANESQFGANDGKSSGNAVGLYQFTPDTWKNTIENVKQKHPETASIVALGRENDYAQVLAMTELMRENADALRKGNKKRNIPNPTYADIYTAHHWGSSRALQPDDVKIASAVKKYEIDANPAHQNDTFGTFRAKYNKQADKNHEKIMAAIEKADPEMYARMDVSAFSSSTPTASLGARQQTDSDRERWISKKDVDNVLKSIILEFFKSDKYSTEEAQQKSEPQKEESTGIFAFVAKVVGGLGITALIANVFGSSSTDNSDTPDNPSSSTPSTTNLAAFTPKLASLPVAEAAQGASVTAPNASSTEKVAQTGGLGVASGS